MAKRKQPENGAATNGHAQTVRAPKGGVRVGGKFYRAGAKMPARYRRAGRSEGLDPASGVPLAAPNFGRFVLPHGITFIGKQSVIASVFRNPDEAVRHSGGQAWKMRRDPAIMECLEARQRATALLNWHLEVEDEKDPAQKELKDQMTKVLLRTRQFTEYRRVLLEALWYGRYAVQHKFAFKQIGGERRLYLADWDPINGDKLVFRFDDGSGKYTDGQVGIRVSPIHGNKDALAGNRIYEYTVEGPAYFLEPHERTLLAVHKHIIEDGDYEDPISAGRIHGVGIRDRIYWCWYQKQETMAQLMEVIDRTGSGITIYWYPAGDDAAKEAVEELAIKQKHENVLVMPRMSGDPAMDAYGIERIEPTTSGIDSMKGVVHEFFGHQIKRYISGQTLTSESEALGIGGGGADVQQETWFQIVRYDAVKLEETISEELVEPLKVFNFPRQRDIPIWFRIDTKSSESEKKMQAIKSAWDMGARVKASDVMDIVGLSMPGPDDETLQNPQLAPQADPLMGGGMMPGEPGAEGQPQNDLEHLLGPLAGLVQQDGGGDDGADGGPEGGEPPPNPSEGGGPVQYAKDWRQSLKIALDETDTDPSPEQKAAGNYAKGKFSWNGLTISIENPAGSQRRPEWKPLAHHYGYINRTEGKDGDHVDVFLGPDLDSDVVFVVDQEKPGGSFDEHKCLLGWHNLLDAKAGYLANYTPNWHCGPITALTVDQFKCWLAEGDTAERVAEQVSRYAKRQIRSTEGQQPLPGMTDRNAKQHHIWREELHPRDESGQFADKPGSQPDNTFGQQYLFSDLASKLRETEGYPDSQLAQAKQQELFEALAKSDVPPEQLAALLSGNDERLDQLKREAESANKPTTNSWDGWSPSDMAQRPMSTHNPMWYDDVQLPGTMQRLRVERRPDGSYTAWKEFVGNPELWTPVSGGKDAAMTMNNIWRSGVGLSPDRLEPIIAAGMAKEKDQSGRQLSPEATELGRIYKGLSPAELESEVSRRQHQELMSRALEQSKTPIEEMRLRRAERKAGNQAMLPDEATQEKWQQRVASGEDDSGEPVATQPWEMTLEEYAATIKDTRRKGGDLIVVLPDGREVTAFGTRSKKEAAKRMHEGAIIAALQAGKTVSPEVLQDHPEIDPLKYVHSPFALQQQKVREGGAPSNVSDTGGQQNRFWHGMDDAPGQKKMFEGMDLAGAESSDRDPAYQDYVAAVSQHGIIPRPFDQWDAARKEQQARSQARPAFGEQEIESRNSPAASAEQEGTAAIAGMPFHSRAEAQAVAKRLEEAAAKHGISGEELWHAVMGDPEGGSSWPLYDQSEDDAVRADIASAKLKPPPPVADNEESGAIADFGEKIGGARKDLARPLGPKNPKKESDDNRPVWQRRYLISRIDKSSNPAEEGKYAIYDTRDTSWGQPRQVGGKLFGSKEEAEKSLPLAAVARNHRVYPERKTRDGPQTYGIFRKVTDKKLALVKGGFASEEDAHRHMAAAPESIIEHKFPDWEDYSYLDSVVRTGKEHRKGNVKTSDFQKAFGFRGGEFGKWQMNQDGQTSLNHAYDALHDLADVLNLPSKAMSLGGQLAIGFGSRGTGGKHSAKAHYESGARAVINLTKMKGAGSLAHEWFHALDNYIAKQVTGKPDSEDLLTSRPYGQHARKEVLDAWKHLVDTMHYKQATTALDVAKSDKLVKLYGDSLHKDFEGLEQRLRDERQYNKRFKAFTPEQQKEWDDLRDKIQTGELGAKKFVEGRSRFGGYSTYENLD